MRTQDSAGGMGRFCPHCGAALTNPRYTNCPHCGGLLQGMSPRAQWQAPTPEWANAQTVPIAPAVPKAAPRVPQAPPNRATAAWQAWLVRLCRSNRRRDTVAGGRRHGRRLLSIQRGYRSRRRIGPTELAGARAAHISADCHGDAFAHCYSFAAADGDTTRADCDARPGTPYALPGFAHVEH